MLTLRPGCDCGPGVFSGIWAPCARLRTFPVTTGRLGCLSRKPPGRGRAESPDRASLTPDGSGTPSPAIAGQRRTCLDLRSGPSPLALWGGSPRIPVSASRLPSGARSIVPGGCCPAEPRRGAASANSFRFPEAGLVRRPGPAANRSPRTLKDCVGWRAQTPLPGRTLRWPGRLKQRRLCRPKALKSIF